MLQDDSDYPDPWKWRWVGGGRQDKKVRGRVFYEQIECYRHYDGIRRRYQVGDVVNMVGEGASWTAQIVNLFQIKHDDEGLRRIIDYDESNPRAKFELMRCTLRWFYASEDLKESIRRSSLPRAIKGETFFSDHVEGRGSNPVTVIDGLAWVLPSVQEKNAFLKEPDLRYQNGLDVINVCRGFVNSAAPDFPVRQLDSGELQYLLDNPMDAKNLYDTARQRMRGKYTASGTIVRPSMKSLAVASGRKRKRVGRKPVDVQDIEDDDSEDDMFKSKKTEPSLERPVSKTRKEKKRKKQKQQRLEKRRKYVVEDDDEGDFDEDYEPVDDEITPQPLQSDPEPKKKKRKSTEKPRGQVVDVMGEPKENVKNKPLPAEDEITPVVREKAKKTTKTRNITNNEPTTEHAPTHDTKPSPETVPRAPYDTSPLKRRTNVAKGHGGATSRHVIVMDGSDTGKKDERQRMMPSITPNRGRYRDVVDQGRKIDKPKEATSEPVIGQGKQRKETKSNAKDMHSEKANPPEDVDIVEEIPKAKGKTTQHKQKDTRVDDPEPVEAEAEVVAIDHVSEEENVAPMEIIIDETIDAVIESRKEDGNGEVQTSSLMEGVQPIENNDDAEWWRETKKVLEVMKTAFNDMSPVSQNLFRRHVDVLFDMVISKVVSYGLHGRVEQDNKTLKLIVKEITAEFMKMGEADSNERALDQMMAKGAEVDAV